MSDFGTEQRDLVMAILACQVVKGRTVLEWPCLARTFGSALAALASKDGFRLNEQGRCEIFEAIVNIEIENSSFIFSRPYDRIFLMSRDRAEALLKQDPNPKRREEIDKAADAWHVAYLNLTEGIEEADDD